MSARLTSVLLASSTPTYSAQNLSVIASRCAPGVFLSVVRGYLTTQGAKALGDAVLEQASADKRHLIIFHDWSEMADYDADARVLLTNVARTILPFTDAIHLFAVSPIVNFGVRVANVILKKVTSYPSATDFDAALQAALARPTRNR